MVVFLAVRVLSTPYSHRWKQQTTSEHRRKLSGKKYVVKRFHKRNVLLESSEYSRHTTWWLYAVWLRFSCFSLCRTAQRILIAHAELSHSRQISRLQWMTTKNMRKWWVVADNSSTTKSLCVLFSWKKLKISSFICGHCALKYSGTFWLR